MERYYTGIGSRRTPLAVLNIFTSIAKILDDCGFILRSGGADGADTAFDAGATKKEIYLPWKGFMGLKQDVYIPDQAYEIASNNHPIWGRLGRPVRALMARNVQQVLGRNLDKPSEFVICWTPDGAYNDSMRSIYTGGTGLAISVASKYNIPVYNVMNDGLVKKLNDLIINESNKTWKLTL